jgi:MoaA/NifB/PqqE/SkfB family radical SAM enzyme
MKTNSGIDKLTLELIRKCPNACQHCSSLSFPGARDIIPINKAKEIITEAHSLGLNTIILSGGEPLIYPGILELIQFIKNKNIEIVIYSSGSIFNDQGQPISIPFSFLKEIKKIGIKRYNLSLHSSVPKIHDEFMKTHGSWQRAVDFISNCIKLDEEVHIHTVLSKYNYNNINSLSVFLSEIEIKTLRILRLVPQGRASLDFKNLEPSEEEYEIFWNQIINIHSKNLSLKIRLGAHLNSERNITEYNCSLDSNKLTITPDGTASICAAFKGLAKDLNSPNINTDVIQSIVDSDWRTRIAEFKLKYNNSCPAQEIYKKQEGTIKKDKKWQVH